MPRPGLDLGIGEGGERIELEQLPPPQALLFIGELLVLAGLGLPAAAG